MNETIEEYLVATSYSEFSEEIFRAGWMSPSPEILSLYTLWLKEKIRLFHNQKKLERDELYTTQEEMQTITAAFHLAIEESSKEKEQENENPDCL